jgi:hypothetical protein
MSNKGSLGLLVVLLLIGGAWFGESRPVGADPAESTPQQVFEKRLLPIFKSPDPSSCVQCHLAGVDLKNYIRPTCEQTFASLRDQGLIDLERPEKSRILALIQMGESDRGASLIQQKMRKAEYEAFVDWIKRSATDPKLRALPKLKPEELAGPARPVEVIRHARRDRLVESFANTIWPQRHRCMSCHTEGSAENKKLVEKNGERVAWFKAAGPEATLAYLRTTNLIDIKEPEKSLLLLKPLKEVEHGGGKKFLYGDQGYKAFRTFVEDYARILRDDYPDATSLPKKVAEPRRFTSEIWFKLENTPPAWGDKLAQVELYAWDTDKNAWEATPIATSDRGVWGQGKLWQHTLTLQAEPGSERAKTWARTPKATLPRGRYLVKVWVDREGKLAKDWRAVLGDADYVGQAEVRSGWPEGYGQMTVLNAAQVKK